MEKRENLFWFCRIENETNFSDWTQKWHYVSQLKSNEQHVQFTHLPAGKYENLLSNIDIQQSMYQIMNIFLFLLLYQFYFKAKNVL